MERMTIFLTVLFLFCSFITEDSSAIEPSSDLPPKSYFKFDIDGDADDTAVNNNEVSLYPDPLSPRLSPSIDLLPFPEPPQRQPEPKGVLPTAPPNPPEYYQIETHYGVVCLNNEAGINIQYFYRWGDEEWQLDTLSENQYCWYSWEYDEGSRISPNFFVKFDADLSNRKSYEIKLLGRYSSNKELCDYGRKYYFTKENGVLSLIEK